MSAFVPIVRKINWGYLVLALLPLFLFMAVGGLVGGLLGAVLTSYAYLGAVLLGRWPFVKHHRRGIRFVKQGRWDEAISHFEQSYDLFVRRPAADRYRFLLLSASAISFREMALLNVAFCHGQAHRRSESIALYERVLREFPGSALAITTLNMMRD